MAFKTYKPRFVRSFRYTDESGETEDIVFCANGYLFPLFKTYTGVELTAALDDYNKELLRLIDKEKLQAVVDFEKAEEDKKLDAIIEHSDEFAALYDAALSADNVGGLSLTETLMIVMRVCALPAEDHAEALAAGLDLLPQECYDDAQLALDLLKLAGDYTQNAKKKSNLPTRKPIGTTRR